MPTAEGRPLDAVLPTGAGGPGRPGADASDGRALYEVAVLRGAADGGGAAPGWRDGNRKRVRRLMRAMGLEAIYQKPNTSKGHPDHKVYPYLLRGLSIDRPNQVWCADITYIPMAKGFVYLVAVMDWYSRRVLAWRMSITMESDFCVEALQEAIARHGQPAIFNTDQGVQFTSAGFLDELESHGIRVSMDGKGRFLDNIFIERLWRSLKYDDVFIKTYGSVAEARRGIGGWLSFYNEERLHQALGYRAPRVVFDGEAHEPVDNASALKGCGVAHRLVGEVVKRGVG